MAGWASAAASTGPSASATFPVAEGDRVGRYIVLYPVGSGGMGCVVAAYDCSLDRKVALKFALSSRSAACVDPRAAREASAMAKLSHPNVVTVFEVGAWGGRTFIAMELVDGATLRDHVADDELASRSWEERRRLLLQAGEGLAAAHAAGLVHRDFKPDNVLVGRDRRARISDFGLASRGGSTPAQTQGKATQRPPGAPVYWAPELCANPNGTPRADQYAFCATAWELLIASRGGPEVPRADPLTLRRVRAVLEKGMQPDPRARYPDLPSLLKALRSAAWSRRRGAWIAVGVVTAGLVVRATVSTPPSDRTESEATAAEASAAAAMAQVWNPTRAEAVGDRLLALAPAVGPDTVAELDKAVDQLARVWIDTRVQVWQDHAGGMTSPHARDWRAACLEERKAELDTAIELLLDPHKRTAGNAIVAVHGLSSPTRCSIDAAVRAADVGRPDPQLAPQVHDLGLRLATSKVQLDAGLYQDALNNIDAVTKEARTVGFAPLLSRALMLRGDAHSRLGDFESSRSDGDEAGRFAAMSHDQAQLARVWVNWALQLANGGAAPDQASAWADAAGVLVAGIEDEPALRGWLSIARGDIAQGAGRWQDALDHYESAAASLAQDGDNNHPLIGLMGANVAMCHSAMGRWAEAKAGFETAIERDSLLLGRGHPRVGSMEQGLAHALRSLGELPAARQVAARALQNLSAALPAHHHDVGKAHYTLATILYTLGQTDDAESHAQQALAVVRQRHGEDHADTAYALWLLGSVALARGDLDGAVTHVERARAAVGDRPHPTAEPLTALTSQVRVAQRTPE